MSITILTAGTGLGVYLPGLMMQRQLALRGVDADIDVWERLFSDSALYERARVVAAFQENYALAQMANKMPQPNSHLLDANAVAQLLVRWRGRKHFAVWSGYWLELLALHRQQEGAIHVDLCRIDATVSASFKHTNTEQARDVWLWRQDKLALEYSILSENTPVLWENRTKRLVLHGGGWSLGSYLLEARALAQHFSIDLLLGNASDVPAMPENVRIWRIDPAWQPWQRDANGKHGYPPMLDSTGAMQTQHMRDALLSSAMAIVCKPGGCTLIDSLNTATPIVFLAPFSEAEAANADVWKALGFGIDLDDWKRAGYAHAQLAALHEALLQQRSKPKCYINDLVQTMTRR
jgi:hypothetical protein